MKKHAAIAILTFIMASPALNGPAMAGENCKCRFNGGEAKEGETVCIRTSSGQMLARCERVQNNTSWKMLSEGCPVGNLRLPLQRDLDIDGAPISIPQKPVEFAKIN